MSLPSDVRALYPFASRFGDVGGVRMHYVDEGQGPVVVLLHGNPTWSFHFRALILALREQFRVIVPDHIGCGLSDKPGRYDYTLGTHIANVGSLLEQLGVSEVTLGVHDWGGAIGFGWAVRHPERVRRFVIFNTAAFFGPCPWRLRICGFPVVSDILIRGLNGFVRGALLMASARRERLTPSVRRGYLFPYQAFRDRIAVQRFVEDIPLHPRMGSYQQIKRIEAGLSIFRKRRAVIFWGGQDFCFHDHFLDRWRQVFPRATVHRYDDAGHYVVEDACERIVPAMRTFLLASDDTAGSTGPTAGEAAAVKC